MSKPRLFVAAGMLLALAPLLAAGGDITVDGKFVSTASTGTPPLEVDSTTMVSNLNAEFLNGLPASAFSTGVSNVVRVGMTEGDFTSIQAALDSITDASIDNFYVVLVGPGVFDESITLKNFVSVIGHGRLETRIRRVGPGNVTAVQGSFLSAITDVWIQAESTDGKAAIGLEGPVLRAQRLLIEATSTSVGQAIGVYTASNNLELIDCDVNARGAGINTGLYVQTPAFAVVRGGSIRGDGFGTSTSTNYGVRVVLGSGSSDVTLRDTSINGVNGSVGYGVRIEAGGVGTRRTTIVGGGSTTAVGFYNAVNTTYTLADSSVSALGAGTRIGFDQTAGTVIVRHSTLTGSPAMTVGAGAQARLGYNQISQLLTGSGTYSCIGNHDPFMSPVGCPP